jgi:hypothetical protein
MLTGVTGRVCGVARVNDGSLVAAAVTFVATPAAATLES